MPGQPIALLAALVCFAALLPAQTEPTAQQRLARVAAGGAYQRLIQKDAAEAIAYLDGLEDPAQVILGYATLLQGLRQDPYSQDHPEAVLQLATAAVTTGQTRAEAIDDDALQERLLGFVKPLAYNLAADTWPGWGGDTRLLPAHLQQGRWAADLNLDLARRLDRPPAALSAAHWVVGAHHLAAGDLPAAASAFRDATAAAREADDQDSILMCRGYQALVAQLQGKAGLDTVLEELMARDTEDARCYADQLRTALEVFRRPAIHTAGPAGEQVHRRTVPGLRPGLAVSHDAGAYATVLASARPGDRLCLLLAADHPDLRLPEGYDDVLPLPAAEILGRLERDEAVTASREARGLHVILLAAPTLEALHGLIHSTDLLP
jgi:hypothetical protein